MAARAIVDGGKRWYRVREAANYLGISHATLNSMRTRGGGPDFSKLSPTIVVYAKEWLDAWAEAGRRSTTSSAL